MVRDRLAWDACQGNYLASPRGIAISHHNSQQGKELEPSSDKATEATAVLSSRRAEILLMSRGTSKVKTISIVCRNNGIKQVV